MSHTPPPIYYYMSWNNILLTYDDCRLACALKIYNRFADGGKFDDNIIGQIIGESHNLSAMNLTGLVDHLKETKNVYPEVDADKTNMSILALNAWNKWLDPEAAPVGTWP